MTNSQPASSRREGSGRRNTASCRFIEMEAVVNRSAAAAADEE